MIRSLAYFVFLAFMTSMALGAETPTATPAPVAPQMAAPLATPLSTPEARPSLSAKLRVEMESVVAKGPLHLRNRSGNVDALQTLLSWEPENTGTLRIRQISPRGEILHDVKKNISKVEFLDSIFQKDSLVDLGGGALVKVTNPLVRSKLDNGTTKVSMVVQLALEKNTKPSDVEMYFDVLVMNLNPLNLWDANSENTPRDRMYGYDLFNKDFSNWYDAKIQTAKAEAVVRELKVAGVPEVVALQELENAGGLSEVFAAGTPLRVMLEGLGYRSFFVGKQGSENSVTITTGFISRYVLAEQSSVDFNIKDDAFKILSERERKSVRFSTRDTQVVELALGVAKARFFNTHWRSKGCSGEESCDLSERVRIVNAEVLRRHFDTLRKTSPDVEIFVMGDFNSAYDDATVEKVGSTSAKAKVAGASDTSLLYNLWYELPKEARWEHEFQGERHTLSQMLLAPGFFGTRGFQYVDHSFTVHGQFGEAHKVLMNPNDTPLRWQEALLKLEEAPHGKRDMIKAVLTERGCYDKKKQSKRKCGAAFSEHIGIGFSDHLPQTARLSFVGDDPTEVAPQFLSSTRSNFEQTVTKRCQESEAVSAGTVEFWKIENVGRCVILDFSGAPQSLRTRGVYEYGYVLVKGSMLGITMNGAYSPKPRSLLGGEKSSDMCFARKVLQHDGGKIVKAVGRLGFDNGMPALFLAERADVKLVDLPKEKKEACE